MTTRLPSSEPERGRPPAISIGGGGGVVAGEESPLIRHPTAPSIEQDPPLTPGGSMLPAISPRVRLLFEIALGILGFGVLIAISARAAVVTSAGGGRGGGGRVARGGEGSGRRPGIGGGGGAVVGGDPNCISCRYHSGGVVGLPEKGFNSGLVTVNATDNSSLFYWYFPAQSGDPNAPIIMWLQGGPGASCLIGLFLEIGPYALRHDPTSESGFEMVTRNTTWAKDHGLIFIDQPVGTGYSFAGSPSGYSTDEDQVAENLYTFLQVFFNELHPETKDNRFYLIAESYGGHFAPNLGVHIMEMNNAVRTSTSIEEHKSKVVINLSGVAIQNGLVDPAVQVLEKPLAAYYFSVIDADELEQAQMMAVEASQLAVSGNYLDSLNVRTKMEDMIRDVSGINLLDVREYGAFDLNAYIDKWANHPNNIAALGLPPSIHWGTDPEVKDLLSADIMKSYANKVQELLETYHLPVLLFQGQFDLKDGVRANQAWIRQMRWSGRDAYLAASQEKWFINDDLRKPAGWAHEAGLLTEVVVSGAGHLAPMTQPASCMDAISRWIAGRTFKYSKGFFPWND